MTDFTLSRPAVFPEDTEVDVYAASDFPFGRASGDPPPGATAVDTFTVVDGELEMTGLDDGTYWLRGDNDRWLQISIGTAAERPGGTEGISDVYGLQDALDGKESSDSDLAAIAALTTTAFGRGLLDDADAAAVRTSIGAGPAWQSGTHAARLALTGVATGTPFYETDTGVLYRYSGSAWIAQSAGAVIKTADETVNNSNTLQDDDHLFFPIEANETWFVEALLRVQAASINADFLWGWTGPTGATASWSLGAAQGGWSQVGTSSSPGAEKTIGNTVASGGGAFNSHVYLGGWFYADATHAGTIKLQWAQNSATNENNKVLAGSHLRLRRIV